LPVVWQKIARTKTHRRINALSWYFLKCCRRFALAGGKNLVCFPRRKEGVFRNFPFLRRRCGYTSHVSRKGKAMPIEFADFEKVDMRVGRVIRVEKSLARKPTYRFTLDFGPEIGEKVSCAALTNYSTEELLGQQVIAVVNFPPKKMGPEKSEVLILGVPDRDGQVIRLRPERDVEPGARVF
jgi:tRNA-binding protein